MDKILTKSVVLTIAVSWHFFVFYGSGPTFDFLWFRIQILKCFHEDKN